MAKMVKSVGNQTGGVVATVKDFGKNIGAGAKATGTAVKAAGAKAASHVSRQQGSLHCWRSWSGGGSSRNGCREPETAGAGRGLDGATFRAT
jgi:hypothetical protein